MSNDLGFEIKKAYADLGCDFCNYDSRTEKRDVYILIMKFKFTHGAMHVYLRICENCLRKLRELIDRVLEGQCTTGSGIT